MVVVDHPEAGIVLPRDDLEPVAEVSEGAVVPQPRLLGRLASVAQNQWVAGIAKVFKRCPGGGGGRGQARDLLVYVYFLLTLKQRLKPLGYCFPLGIAKVNPFSSFVSCESGVGAANIDY